MIKKGGFIKVWLLLPLLALFISTVVILSAGAYGYWWYHTPFSEVKNEKLFEVKKGATLNQISHLLERESFISNKKLFSLIGRLQGRDLKAGEYLLSPSLPPSKIFPILEMGKPHLYSVTIPEGYNLVETATLLEQKGFVDKKRFLEISRDPQFIKTFPFVKGKDLEGYLFPSTYFFPKGMTEKEIIKKMLHTFEEVVFQEIGKRRAPMDLTSTEVITLASLVEKETSLSKEKPIIASVFYNRLRKNMRLQCDPTVIYAIKDFDGNIRKKDLKIDSPYNTYRYKGLPPGPIANPGKESVMAVLKPQKTDYLYFVATKKGGHFFSTTFKKHNKAVRKYQLGKG